MSGSHQQSAVVSVSQRSCHRTQGWHNVGWHNKDMLTPNADALVRSGMQLHRSYTFWYCAPTRSSIMVRPLRVRISYCDV